MNSLNLYTLFFALFCALAMVNGESKLQIGIKKRVENCTIKTRKGDLVHMHYTVSNIVPKIALAITTTK